jgi:cobaltochelatase CobT
MSLTNHKPKSGKIESPTEPFKRALADCTRAIAGDDEVEVMFTADRPGIAGKAMRLPEPSRKMSHSEATLIRGHGDALALKFALHNPRIHSKFRGDDAESRMVFEAMENMRVEAIGSRRMDGVKANLTARLEKAYEQVPTEFESRDDAPLADALALLARERLTGVKPPKTAEPLVALWREILDAKIGKDLKGLEAVLEDQLKFGQAVQKMLSNLRIEDELPPDQSDDEEEDKDEDSKENEGESEENKDNQTKESMKSDEATEFSDEKQEGQMTESDAPASLSDDFDMTDSGEPQEPQRPHKNLDPNKQGLYKAYTTEFDECLPAEDLADAEELDRLRAYLDKQLVNMQSVVARLANRLQRRLMAQ